MADDQTPSTRHSVSDEESITDDAGLDYRNDSQEPGDDDASALILDPSNSQRLYWRDIRTKIVREIWRPGDGDGNRATDYFDKIDPPSSIGNRWKFYQLSLGPIKHDHNEPPKYVFLDDRAAYELIQSDVPRTSLGRFWPHDFGLSGKLRDRRPHRGRGSVGDPDVEGDDQYNFTHIGIKNTRYYFTGEKHYTPVIYRSEALSAEIAKRLEKKRKGWSIRNKDGKDPKNRGHNQFTPKEWLVKNGAPSKAKAGKKKKKKGAMDHKVPDWLLDKPKQPHELVASRESAPSSRPISTAEGVPISLQSNIHNEPQEKKRKLDGDVDAAGNVPVSGAAQFPLPRPSGHQPLPPSFYIPSAGSSHPHQESNCPYTESRAYITQLEKDLATAHDIISEQKSKIAELEGVGAKNLGVIEELRRELQDLRWSITR